MDKDQYKNKDEYGELVNAMNEEDILMEKIERFIEENQDKSREEIEKIINEEYLNLLEKAKKRTSKAMLNFRKSIKEEIKEVEKILDSEI
jgi:hypothetical protein